MTEKNKDTFELVTSADLTIDNQIRNLWQREFPHIPLFSEESTDPRLEGMEAKELQKLPVVLVVDPIDGSGRLARHSDRFSTSFALVAEGIPVMTVIYKSVGDTFWTAEIFEGAFKFEGKFKDRKQIEVSKTVWPDKAMISTAFAWDLGKRGKNQRHINRLLFFTNQLLGTASSVLDGVDVAGGQTDAHISEGLKPWDMAGFALLVNEAGGKSTTIWTPDWHAFEDNILASNGIIHENIRTIVTRNFILATLAEAMRRATHKNVKEKRDVFKALRDVQEKVVFLIKKLPPRKQGS